eukprot:CAMPEP_0119280516 /NCGR_PEP_ID=MMETSP1329-20130426/22802_1 /TAXON_ID=114041 /ORGANISM="Genus nov. species nov., Strain RCC1024" /LENGTH=165 /DNA_ID=CAMNT_0007281105 /DNA_START=48 /DNA_END=541 /DNA_ORIENTATION=-
MPTRIVTPKKHKAKRRASVFLDKTWDEEDAFSCRVDYASATEESLRGLLRDRFGPGGVAPLKSRKALVQFAKRNKLHEALLRGADAVLYRTTTIVSLLSRLEHTVPDARRTLAGVELVRRAEWAIVKTADRASGAKVGAVVSALGGEDALLRPWADTVEKVEGLG